MARSHRLTVPSRRRVPSAVRRLLLALVVPLAALAASCDVGTADVVVRDDLSGTLTVTVVPTDEWLSRGGDALWGAASEQLLAADGGPVTVDRVTEPEGTGLRITWEFDDVAELTRPLPVTSAAVPLQPITRFDVTEVDDGWRLDAEVQPLTELVRALPLQVPGAIGTELLNYQVSVTLPGRIVTTNAPEFSGSRATWDVSGGATGPVALTARTGPGAPVNPALLLVGGAVGLVVVGLGVAWWSRDFRVRRRLRRSAAGMDASDNATWAPPPAHLAGPSPSEPTTAASAEGMYAGVTGDRSAALPVGGAAWGPAPSPDAAPTGATAVVAGDQPEGDGAPAGPVPPGWYDDPDGSSSLRWWDGAAWTDHRS